VKVPICNGPGRRADLRAAIRWIGEQQCLSVIIEAGSKLNGIDNLSRRFG
jgi:riboflavin biosynthesis pyrimidine reductase